jgi:hypothetical protein
MWKVIIKLKERNNMKIVQSLNDLIRITPDIQSIYILDKEGVPIVSAGWYFNKIVWVIIRAVFFFGGGSNWANYPSRNTQKK